MDTGSLEMLSQMQLQKQHQNQLRKEEGCSPMPASLPLHKTHKTPLGQHFYVTYDTAF